MGLYYRSVLPHSIQIFILMTVLVKKRRYPELAVYWCVQAK